MTQWLQNKGARLLPVLMDALFALWLFTEVAFEHTLLSRAALLLFCLLTLVWCVVEKKAFFHLWMGFFLLLILWSLLGARLFALDKAASLGSVKTLCVCLGFLFCLYQYLRLRNDLAQVCLAYMAATLAVVLCTLIKSWPLTLSVLGRFGMEADINPNWIGMLSAYTFAMSFHRALWKKPLWLLPAVLFVAVVLLTKSTKAYAMVGLLGVALFLFRFPKRWPLKLLAILGAGFFLFRVVLWQFNSSYDVFFQKIRYIYENLFMGGTHLNSLTDRADLSAIGLTAFRARPFTGYGLDGFRFLPGTRGTYSHNNYIELLVSGGVPLLVLFYLPQLIALVRAWRYRTNRPLRFAGLLTVTEILMDVGMVAYLDRTALMIPLLLYAALAAARAKPGDGTKLFAFLQNPCVLVRWCSTRGLLAWMPDKLYLRLLYRGCTGRKLHLNKPVTMNEKLQWTKLYDHNPLYPTLVDKLAVRDYVESKGCGAFLIPLLGAWDRPEDIPFSDLPNRFVLKCTHDSGGVRICPDKARFDRQEALAFLKNRMAKSYYTAGREWPYKHLAPRVMAEAYIGDENGKAPDDVKLYCFNGRVEAVMLCQNRTRSHADYYYFDRDFHYFPIGETTKAAAASGRVFEKPAHLPELIRIAETLSAGLPQLRVDLYDTNGRVYFGELTLFDQSGFATDTGEDGDRALGALFTLPEVSI